MKKQEYQKLLKLEKRIQQIANDELGLKTYDIEFDVCNPQKMLEIMAYRIPTNVNSWKYGRDFERLRTIYEHHGSNLPYEVVINSNPSRAYLMNTNTFAVHCLVISHVYGHVNIFTENKYFRNSRQDIVEILRHANKRFNEYERRYGINEVEMVVDAGHSIQLHSSPFESETEEEKRERIFNQIKAKVGQAQGNTKSEFGDLVVNKKSGVLPNQDIELILQNIKRNLRLKTPVESTGDLLRYIIDNSRILEDWQKDILEMLRMEGQYYWPQIKTRYLNEGWSVFIHEKIMNQLFRENLLNASEHAQYNYSNSLVKAENPVSMNPYLIGSSIWKDIENRWDKGQHGKEWELCENEREKENWDTKEMKGWEKCRDTMRVYTDWFFLQEFLTVDIVKDLKIYIFEEVESTTHFDYVITKHKAKEIRDMIIRSFAQGGVPTIEVVDGNTNNRGELTLLHKWDSNLNKEYAQETCKHICRMWGSKIYLMTKQDNKDIQYTVEPVMVQKIIL